MRTKTLGGLKKRKRPPSATPSLTTIPLLSTTQDGNDATLFDTSSESDGDLLDVPMADSIDGHCNGSSLDVLNHESIDLLDRSICICCNNGGGVLVCSEKGCPVTLHAKCMCFGPKFDDLGNFYCPYCWYKLAVERSQELRKKAMIAKKTLSSFLDNNVVTSDGLVQKDEAAKRKEPFAGDGISLDSDNQQDTDGVHSQPLQQPEGDQLRKLNNADSDQYEIAPEGQADADGDFRPCREEEMSAQIKLGQDSMNRGKFDKPNNAEAHETGFFEEKESFETEYSGHNKEDECERIVEVGEEAEPLSVSHLGKHTDGCSPDIALAKGTQERVAKSAENKGRMTYKGKVPHTEQKATATGSSVSETNDPDSEAISGSKHHGKQTVQKTVYPQKVASVKKSLFQEHNIEEENAGNINEEVTSSKTLRKSPRSSKQVKKWALPTVKRKRLHWTAEEEKALEGGVLRFSKDYQNIPWRKILEFYHHVFDETRTPVDLKDKWRNMTSKKGCK